MLDILFWDTSYVLLHMFIVLEKLIVDIFFSFHLQQIRSHRWS